MRRFRLFCPAVQASLLLVLCAVFLVPAAWGQYINQEEVVDLLNRRTESLNDIPEVHYDYYVLKHSRNNSVMARNTFYKIIGDGDTRVGEQRSLLVEMINRKLMYKYQLGDTIIVPQQYDLDFRAYSPFPRYYPGAREFDKLFILHKTVQAFAAYENGQLVRWGIINTGAPQVSPTPNGRFNFNWREEYRVSSLSPPGEEWEMYWVVNFHHARGIHVHQYEMPTGGPESHGCVRLVDADAEWVYNWADLWKTSARGDGIGSATGRVLEQGTIVLVVGEEPDGKPQPFELKKQYPILKRVDLPVHPYDVPAGTSQQEHFDKIRLNKAKSSDL